MDLSEIREELEEDLTWRLDELRHLRNQLLGELKEDDWPAAALRAVLVMQYAHLEGFVRNSFTLYVAAINQERIRAEECHPNLFAAALIGEFDALRLGAGSDQMDESTRLYRRANVQVSFVEKLRAISSRPIFIDSSKAVSMEMNFGTDVLRRTLYILGIPEDRIGKHYYRALEFVRRTRNDVAHGDRRERIEHGEFKAHTAKCEDFMRGLTRVISSAVDEQMFRGAR